MCTEEGSNTCRSTHQHMKKHALAHKSVHENMQKHMVIYVEADSSECFSHGEQ